MVLLMGLARAAGLCRDGLLPRSWSVTSARRKTPVRLQLLVGVIVALLAGFTKVELLEEMINIGTLSAFVLVSIGVLVLRKSAPTPEPVTACLCACAACALGAAVLLSDAESDHADLAALSGLDGAGCC
jgi:amino acid transporter